MLSPLIRRPRKKESNDANSKQRGVTLALVAASLVALIAMAALSIDIGTLYQAKAEAQRAADAAALTAARLISISGVTGDPNTAASWQAVCGAGGTATVAAKAVAQSESNFVGGSAASTARVTYGTGAGSDDCSALAGATSNFTVNPTVTVYVQQAKLPTFFARVFSLIPGGTSSNFGVSATATAEVYNPSGSSTLASGMVPVQPRCVKPWIVPNEDPNYPTNCTAGGCSNFVQLPAGTIPPAIQGITLGGAAGAGVIGASFTLIPDCSNAGGTCNSGPTFNPNKTPPQANATTTPPLTPNLQYLPAYVQNPSPAAPSCGAGNGDYQQAIAGCDNTTPYQCGVQSAVATAPTQVNLNENPYGGTGDTSTAAQCLIHEAGAGAANGQDVLVTDPFPFQIQAGSANPVTGVPAGGAISSSDSIVSLPIYDGVLATGTQQPAVTIIGFLQVFINWVNADGSLNVTVLNVAGCGNASTSASPYVTGTSPVPVRLITPP
jgi:Flp pilus assembly protein TadG